MITIARNLVTIRLEFEGRAREYLAQTVKQRRAAQKQLKKLEASYHK